MKRIHYKLKHNMLSVSLPYTEANVELAKAEAHNGEIEILQDTEAAAPVLTVEERLDELTEAVNLLLQGAQE
jgi:hypothetical protein